MELFSHAGKNCFGFHSGICFKVSRKVKLILEWPSNDGIVAELGQNKI